jgi:hypothetical protein
MLIEFASNSGMSRARLLSYVKAAKNADPALRVVDLGGAALPWTSEVADAFVDLSPSDKLPTIVGDLHSPELWRRIREGGFNFCICSHTLEDLRDPLFVLGQIKETFRHGYIAVPNKHVEFGHIESSRYVGYGHHRWVFTLALDALRLIAKFPFASHFSPRRRFVARLRASAPANALRHLRGRKSGLSAVGPLTWWDAALAGPGNELAFVWKGSLSFEVINADYAGESILALARLYRDELRDGL